MHSTSPEAHGGSTQVAAETSAKAKAHTPAEPQSLLTKQKRAFEIGQQLLAEEQQCLRQAAAKSQKQRSIRQKQKARKQQLQQQLQQQQQQQQLQQRQQQEQQRQQQRQKQEQQEQLQQQQYQLQQQQKQQQKQQPKWQAELTCSSQQDESQPAIDQQCSAAAGQTQLLEPEVLCNAAVGVVDLSRACANGNGLGHHRLCSLLCCPITKVMAFAKLPLHGCIPRKLLCHRDTQLC